VCLFADNLTTVSGMPKVMATASGSKAKNNAATGSGKPLPSTLQVATASEPVATASDSSRTTGGLL
jgi:hypothetical protein